MVPLGTLASSCTNTAPLGRTAQVIVRVIRDKGTLHSPFSAVSQKIFQEHQNEKGVLPVFHYNGGTIYATWYLHCWNTSRSPTFLGYVNEGKFQDFPHKWAGERI